ncbi:MAG: SUMF1/EgtB/PvdO family nonheme iron enzyme [Microscillaceae bacterium]|nr:SUMF1/EgtB/PvdO family nonheme iron enzyme [Microscillaceae bacterium]
MKITHIAVSIVLVVLLSASFFFSDSHHIDSFEAYSQEIPGSKITIDMLPIPEGTYLMGSPAQEANRLEDEGPQHKVKIQAFWMSKFEITWEQYELFMAREIDHIQGNKAAEVNLALDGVSGATAPYTDMSFGMGKEGFPAINMTQYAAATFCKWLSAKTGHFYRLPTEAEWEYACRAGSQTTYHFGNDPAQLPDFAWFAGNSQEIYHPIGQKKPNAWGLHDMHGNVAEWTLDQYLPDFYQTTGKKTFLNPWATAAELYPHTVRGGSWKDQPNALRAAARRGSVPAWKKRDPQLPKSLWWLTDAPFVGFRIVRPVETPSPEAMEKYWGEPIEEY